MKTEQTYPAKTVIRAKTSGRFYVDAPPTGFKSTLNRKRATVFASTTHARNWMSNRGVGWEVELLDARHAEELKALKASFTPAS